jgi:hypothetical protein
MEFEIVAGGIVAGLLALSAYNQYRGNRAVANANARVEAFGKEVAELNEQYNRDVEYHKRLGLPTQDLFRQHKRDIQRLSKKYDLVTLTADFSVPGEFETEKVTIRGDRTTERYVSDGKKWIRYK